MAKPAQAGLPLERALIDSVTRQDHDHLILLNKVNSTFQEHTNSIQSHTTELASHAELIKELQRQVAALQPKTA